MRIPALSTSHRVLVVGLDGATPDLVEPWMRAGYLPALSQLVRQGGTGRFRSVLPVLSPAAWASFATGVNPGRHGIFDFAYRVSDSYHLRLVTARDLKAPTLWRLLSDAGKRVAIINVPMTYPPEPVNGVMITGLGTPDRQIFTYPPELGQRLRARGYQVNKSIFYRPGGEAAFLKAVYDITRRVADTALDVLRQEPWDLFMVVFRDSDEMAHFFWKHTDPQHPAHNPQKDGAYATALLDYYRYLDRIVGQIVETAGPDVNVIVMSDHGVGPLYKDVFLNEWLRQQGLLKTSANLGTGAGGALVRWGLTRSNVSRLLQHIGLASFERGLRAALGQRINLLPAHSRAVFPDAIDWSQTRAFSFGYHGQIFLNVRGREPAGIVEPGAEYMELRRQIEKALRAMVDPADGQPVVSAVIPKEAAFHGPYTEAGPDLIVIMRNLAYITRQGYEFDSQPGRVFSSPNTFESGSHRLDGLLFVAGPDFLACGGLPVHSILDLAPTILHVLGLPVAKHMEGKVMLGALASTMRHPTEADYGQLNQGVHSQDLTEEEERELIERLQNLGYLG